MNDTRICTMEYGPAKKDNEITSLPEKWTELETNMLSEISQTQKGKYHIFLLYVESVFLNKDMKVEKGIFVEGLAGGGRGTRESSRRVSMISINSMQL
jgi:hypothetical protein